MNETALEAISRGVKELTSGTYFPSLVKFLSQVVLFFLLVTVLYYLVHIGNRFVEDKRKISFERRQMLNFILGIIAVFLCVLIFSVRSLLLTILTPFFGAVIMAYILNPIVKQLQKRGIKRIWGVLIVYLAISLLILGISLTIIPKMNAEMKGLLELLPEFSNRVYEYLNNIYTSLSRNLQNLPAEFDGIKNMQPFNGDRIQQFVFNIFTNIINSLLGIFTRIFSLILIPVVAFYFLKDAEQFKRSLILIIPRKSRKKVLDIFKDFDEVLGGFIRGQLIVAFIVGLLTTIALLILDVSFAVIVGFIAGIANVIPFLGPIIGIVPGVFFALMDSPMKALWVIIIFTGIQQIESGILSPKIVGKSVGIHPVWIILSLIIGGKLFGLMGLLFAVPVAGIIKVLSKHLVDYIANF